jgi:hypothetical protein
LAGIAERDSRARESVIRCPDHKMLGRRWLGGKGQSYSENLRARVWWRLTAAWRRGRRPRCSVFSVSYIAAMRGNADR